ncbi:MAG TPA: hypothetical protein VKU87_10505 [Thermomicrobiaceae bacterium]|nr:hypothetical protein [Thermomicrobiaceae bacterium]
MRRRREQRNISYESYPIEIVTPRASTAGIISAENLIAALGTGDPVGLEIVGTPAERRFLLRASSPAMRQALEAQLAAIYPQAQVRPVEPGSDPARRQPDEQVTACTLVLRNPAYLPLRTFRDEDFGATHADPILGILGALSALPSGWRGLAQLVLQPAPNDWCASFARLAIEDPLAAERARGGGYGQDHGMAALAALLIVSTLGLQGARWYAAGAWSRFALLVGAVLTILPLLVWMWRRLSAKPIYDRRLVQEKVRHQASTCEIRLAVFAPMSASESDVVVHLTSLAAAYRQFGLATGNALVSRHVSLDGRDLADLAFVGPARTLPILTTPELAGLWHLPQAAADVPLLERTAARQHPPRPETVSQGAPIGVALHQGQPIRVALPMTTLDRHLLLVAKTRRGKSSLLLRLAHFLMEVQPHRSLVLVDPHQDLARAALGVVPRHRQDQVVYLDVSDRSRPFGLNLLDVGLFHDRDQAVSNTLTIFRREFDRFWGPRMEDAFRFALLTLYEANRAICVADLVGRARQYTILDIPALLVDPAFRRRVMEVVTDPVITTWWTSYFERLDRRFQLEIVNPVQTKVQRFAGSRAARALIGQPRSTIDPSDWLDTGSVVIVNTAKGVVGADTAALLGATLLNLVALVIAEQAVRAPSERRQVTLMVDEFHTMPGADYETILAELAKYGANLILATQSLARLDVVDQADTRALRATLFANLDGLVAFQTSAEDAHYLVRELGPEVDEHDLIALPERHCYVKASAAGAALPTFSVRLDPPPASDADLADRLTAASARRFGRDRAEVEGDLQAALDRIAASHQAVAAGTGVARDLGDATQGSSAIKLPRNAHRRAKRPPVDSGQSALFGPTPIVSPPTPAEGDAS